MKGPDTVKFWQKLFRKKRQRYQEEDWEQLVYTREGVNFGQAEERNAYVDECLDQMMKVLKEKQII